MNQLQLISSISADRNYFDGYVSGVFSVFAALVGVVVMVLGIAVVALLVWNSFKVRSEVRALSADVSALRGEQPAHPLAGTPTHSSVPGAVATADANAAATAEAEASDASASRDASEASAPKAPPAAPTKPKRAPRKKPSAATE
jgi:hypothetical protein